MTGAVPGWPVTNRMVIICALVGCLAGMDLTFGVLNVIYQPDVPGPAMDAATQAWTILWGYVAWIVTEHRQNGR